MHCPATGAKAGDEGSILGALLSDAVGDKVVVAKGELDGDQRNRRATVGSREQRGGAGQIASRPAGDEHYIRAFLIAGEQPRRDGPGTSRTLCIHKDSGTTRLPAPLKARDNELDSLVMI